MYQVERVRSIIFFIMCLVPMFSCWGNRLHDIIKKHGINYTTFEESTVNCIEQDFLGDKDSFKQAINEDPTRALQPDDNGFLPIDMLIIVIKLLRDDRAGDVHPRVANVFIESLSLLAQEMIKQGQNLTTERIKVVETSKEYLLSPLGLLLSPFSINRYVPQKVCELHVSEEQQNETKYGNTSRFCLLERRAFQRLWSDETIRKNIHWKGVRCINSTAGSVISSTPLHSMVVCNDQELLDAILLEEGIDINALDEGGYTPLMRAVYRCEFDDNGKLTIMYPDENIVKRLLQYLGISLNDRCKETRSEVFNQTPLEITIRYGFIEVTEMLCKKGANPQVPGNSAQQNLFHIAASSCYLNVLAALEKVTSQHPNLAKTAITQKDSDGNTPLHCLLKWGMDDESTCKKFLEYGADLTVQNNLGETPLHLLATRSHREMLFELFKKHAQEKNIDFATLLNFKNRQERTLVDELSGYSNDDLFLKKVKEYGGKAAAELPKAPASTTSGDPVKSLEDDSLKTSDSEQTPPSQNVLSNRWVQGTLAVTVGVGLFFALERLFKREKNVTEAPVGHKQAKKVLS